MLFNSLQFFLFFPIVTILYFLLPHKFRWIHLLAASCIFYIAFIPVYIFILIFTIIIDYIAGILIENAKGKKRKQFLLLSIIANVGVLVVFKYYNFFSDNINHLLHAFHISTFNVPLLGLILPIGLSFHTFQAMSYTIEVYRGNQKAERHFGIYALYVMFYPQLVAGPIERPQNLIHQFKEEHHFDYENAANGLRLMLWGMFKKVVIADKLALFVDPVFTHPSHYPSLTLLIATLFFTFEIYCDFSGYSDIAIGAARVMGFTLMKNFDKPYWSKSVAEFWKRWHISLSTWFRDYLYISLGGNRVSIPRWYFNLFIVFLVSGFWHGANWTFIAWGALHGFYLVFAIIRDKLIGPIRIPARNFFNVIITFILVSITWVFFRANSISDAFYILKRLPGSINDVIHLHSFRIGSSLPLDKMPASIALIIFLLLVEAIQGKTDIQTLLKKQPFYLRWGTYYILIAGILLFGEFGSRTFIYFQF
jgi:alginate O-acetyltransferase complex protein AlgI